ncbi:hypothetical protein CMI47_02765 [Candidatus Pacearchaeota archaeon]|nr:hypothetical protein [Candidatus Pacearchaeota archaeon]
MRDRIGLLLALTADLFWVSVPALLSRKRTKTLARARHAAMSTLYAQGIPQGRIGDVFQRDTSTVSYGVKAARSLARRDPGYAEKLERLRRSALQIFAGPAHRGAVRYVSPRARTLNAKERSNRETAYALKTAEPAAVKKATAAMKGKVKRGSALIPIPDSTGSTVANLLLAQSLARATNSQVLDSLRRTRWTPSNRQRHMSGDAPLTVEEHFMVWRGPSLAGREVLFIDNVISTGSTFDAARAAVGTGHGLAFADARGPWNGNFEPAQSGRANRSLRSRAGQVRKEAEGIWREIGPNARHPDYRTKKKPAAGRCYQTALWLRDKFPGHGRAVLVQGAEGSCKKHYWLRVGGVDVDITGDQYGHPKVQVGELPYQGKVRSWPKSRVPSGHPGAMMRGRANRRKRRGQRFILLELILAGRIGHLERRMQKLEGRRNLHPAARTAITRKGASAPLKKLWSQGNIRGSVLDFGAGRGGDASWLRRKGQQVAAYDPHHGPTKLPRRQFDTVLCTYVLNVIPPKEQKHVLRELRSLIKPGGTAYVTVRTDTCPAPVAGVQECVKMGAPVAASGSGFRTYKVIG